MEVESLSQKIRREEVWMSEMRCYSALPVLIRDCVNPPADPKHLLGTIKVGRADDFLRLMLLVGLNHGDAFLFNVPYSEDPNDDTNNWVDCENLWEALSGRESSEL